MDYQIFLSGTVTALVTKTTTAPLDRLKILYQIQNIRTPGKYTSIFSSIKTICKEEGYLGLYKGNFVNSLRSVPSYSLKFTFNDYYKKQLNNKTPSVIDRIRIGMMTGVSQILLTYPLDILRTRYSMTETKSGILQYTKQMIKTEGVRGLYKGIPISLFTGSLHVCIQMTAFDIYKSNSKSTSMVNTLMCGSMAGITAGLITYPGDVLKKQMHANGILGEHKLYSNTLDCIKQIAKKEKIKGFYKGVHICILKTIPTAALQFAVFDFVSKTIKNTDIS